MIFRDHDKSGALGRDGDLPDELLPVVYDALRALARQRMAKEPPGQTLQPTALVHEVYLRLSSDDQNRWLSRAHFFASAARAMRRILIDRARHHASQKRGGDKLRVEFVDPPDELSGPSAIDLIALDDALTKLEQQDPRLSSIITMRYFGGLSVEEVAEVLEVSSRTVVREWRCARAWLYNEIFPSTSH